MRVGINVEQLLYRSPGGIGRYTAQLLTLLPRATTGPAGAGTEVVAFAAWHRRESLHGAFAQAGVGAMKPPARIALPRPLLYEAWVRFGAPPITLSARGLGGLDLVHAPSLAVPPKTKTPLVVTVFDAASEIYPRAFTARGRQFHRRGLSAAAKRADLVITATQAAADEIVAHSRIAEERVRVVPLCVDPPARAAGAGNEHAKADEQAVAADALARFGLSSTRYVLWVGSLEPRKDVSTLVTAMSRLGRRGTKLVLAGYEGWLTDSSFPTGDQVLLGADLVQLGQVSEADLWALYSGATIFALPSRHEGFGLPVLEAMSQGAPVICSDIPALREVAGSAARFVRAGDVSEWTDALLSLLDDDSAREALGRAGVERSAEFGAERMARLTLAVYEEALGGKKGASTEPSPRFPTSSAGG